MDILSAFAWAQREHGNSTQGSPDGNIRAHLMAVASDVLRAGGSETAVQAAFCHEAPRLSRNPECALICIGASFFQPVASMVKQIAPPVIGKDWTVGITDYIEKIPSLSLQAQTVIIADHLDHLVVMQQDVRKNGVSLSADYGFSLEIFLRYHEALLNELSRLPLKWTLLERYQEEVRQLDRQLSLVS